MGGLTYRREEDYFFTTFGDFTLKLYDGYYDDLPILCRSYLSKYVISEGDIIVDAGAYIGAFCLVVSRLVGTAGKIVAFEPDTINYKRLLNNIRLNKVTNIIPINKGLWSEDAILQFSNGYNGESSFFFDDTKLNSVIPVPVVSLDNELDRLGIGRVDFIKMDIEGAEIRAIEGCKKILKENHAAAAIAAYHVIDGEQTHLKLAPRLRGAGYKVEVLFPEEHLTLYASR